ncbi:hypothetical protein KFL_004220125 [Klebsormidium nitens]|uniref:Cyclic nucleotide-binding domain-containing protein n=1 Tax=Klebsormidium nitens TaxID=105231 RepID=A0A1Y1IBN1_KLENI|nr:hypothetical protein KFL_004220125 [Klebsormidium nitens]|eukprot:GAQ88374.1 hypothetical protein KFL_004220125 [Klebsormidium nitens]
MSYGSMRTQREGLPPAALAKAIISLVDGRKRFPSEAQPQAALLLARLSPFVAEQPPRVQLDICGLLRLERCYNGQVLQRQGGRGRSFYILLKGLVEETVAAADRSRTDLVRALRPGDSFGAEAIRKRKYTCPTAIQCQSPCYFLKLDKASRNTFNAAWLLKQNEESHL